MHVSVVSCPDYEPVSVRAALLRALEPFGGIARFPKGSTVAVKANLVSMMKPDSAATTHPALICELIRLLKEQGCRAIVGDSPGGLYTKLYVDRVYAATGLKAVTEAGGELNENYEVKEISFPEARQAKTFTYTAWLDEADYIIDFCKLKTHGMMAFSGAVKNLFGCIPGTMKPEYHYRFPDPESFADMLIDLNEFFKPTLSLIDGVVGMEGNGPTMGKPRQVGVLICSDSPHAADAVGAGIIGLHYEDVPTLAQAVKRGLLPVTREEIPTEGDRKDLVIADYQRVETVHSLRFSKDSDKFFGKLSSKVIDRVLASRPRPKKTECIGCGKCASICPAKAITMKNKLPTIDKSVCIRCFCCQEFCPVGAMKVHRTAIASLLVKNGEKKAD